MLPILGASYVGASYVLLRKPTILHKTKKDRVMSNIKHISHRGGAAEYPENTMAAFRNAVKAGTEMLEIDLHLTKDGKVVVFHDKDLFRVTGIRGQIKDINYNELPQVSATQRVPFPLKAGDQLVVENTADLHIPTLEEVFQTFPEIPFNLDLKADSEELMHKTHDLIKKYNKEDLVIWGGFTEQKCKKAFKKDPDIPLLFSYQRVAKLLALYYSGLLPFFSLKESYLEIPIFTEKSAQSIPFTSERARNMSLWMIKKLLLNQKLFEHLNKRGIRVFAWVQNTEEDFEYCFKHGINGVMTDKPTLLRQYLKNKSL